MEKQEHKGQSSPPSMRDFDYFEELSETAVPTVDDFSDLDSLSSDGPAVALTFKRRRLRLRIQLTLALSAAGGMAVLLWGERDSIRYAFSSQVLAVEMGDVTGFGPADLQHNTYVRLTGITEHRGFRQKRFRNLDPRRREYWYFRLLGSQGVFVEAPSHDPRFGFTTQIDVSGRVIDPTHDPVYSRLLDTYHERFIAPRRGELRVIQVGHRPGDGRIPYIAAFGLVLAVLASNGWVIWRLARLPKSP